MSISPSSSMLCSQSLLSVLSTQGCSVENSSAENILESMAAHRTVLCKRMKQNFKMENTILLRKCQMEKRQERKLYMMSKP